MRSKHVKARMREMVMLLFSIVVVSQVSAEEALRLDQIILKGTHNSYASRDCNPPFGGGNDCPLMHNPPFEQIDDWGVWACELDFSFIQHYSSADPFPYVGHDGWSGCTSWADASWTGPLRLYLDRIKNTRAFRYRPVIIKFDYKTWGLDQFDDPTVCGTALESLLIEIFGRSNIFGPDDFSMTGTWPTVAQLAGKVIPLFGFGLSSGTIFAPNRPVEGLLQTGKVEYTNLEEVNNLLPGDSGIIFLDQYQVSWTFDYAAPPNPVYVRSDAPFFSIVSSDYGENCSMPCATGMCPDPTNTDQIFVVAQEGTFRFPFRSISSAVDKAFSGWTILIESGTYEAPLVIDKNVKLEATGGVVRIE